MRPSDEAILAAVEKGFAAEVDFLKALVRIPSQRGAEGPAQDLYARACRDKGINDRGDISIDLGRTATSRLLGRRRRKLDPQVRQSSPPQASKEERPLHHPEAAHRRCETHKPPAELVPHAALIAAARGTAPDRAGERRPSRSGARRGPSALDGPPRSPTATAKHGHERHGRTKKPRNSALGPALPAAKQRKNAAMHPRPEDTTRLVRGQHTG